ncbi:uncharacterized protein LOC128559657 [Mercenaria mercenaria]|uniref:uncharacterized protein LOC128559657 n=1 Tax=Mercenaria mercenaria TaxID=6596 RepID=UPI00234F597F|nr:uncharacterized protein LOC128559657 [Mercenaria mercenaria]
MTEMTMTFAKGDCNSLFVLFVKTVFISDRFTYAQKEMQLTLFHPLKTQYWCQMIVYRHANVGQTSSFHASFQSTGITFSIQKPEQGSFDRRNHTSSLTLTTLREENGQSEPSTVIKSTNRKCCHLNDWD